jgi:Protein of unknown function (DUF3251)
MPSCCRKTLLTLTPGAEGYSVIQTDLGRLTVSLENIQEYANGSRITLRLGNPLSASINGAKGTIEWGVVDASGTPNNDNAKSKEFSFNQSLRSGAWTNVSIVLDGVPPSALGFVRIKEMGHQGISLMQ